MGRTYDILVSIVLLLLQVCLPLYNIPPSTEPEFSKLMNDPSLTWLLLRVNLKVAPRVALNFVSFNLYHINHHILFTLSPWLWIFHFATSTLLPLYKLPLSLMWFKKNYLIQKIVLTLIITYLSSYSNIYINIYIYIYII